MKKRSPGCGSALSVRMAGSLEEEALLREVGMSTELLSA
jgi:hypothetical protein